MIGNNDVEILMIIIAVLLGLIFAALLNRAATIAALKRMLKASLLVGFVGFIVCGLVFAVTHQH